MYEREAHAWGLRSALHVTVCKSQRECETVRQQASVKTLAECQWNETTIMDDSNKCITG